MTYMYRYCTECGLEMKAHESICPRCESPEIGEEEITTKIVNPAHIGGLVTKQIGLADGMLKTEWPCFICGHDHFMVMPVQRDQKDYNTVHNLTTLPQCPKRVWGAAKNIKMPLAVVLAKYRIEG